MIMTVEEKAAECISCTNPGFCVYKKREVKADWRPIEELTEIMWYSHDIVVKHASKFNTNDKCDYEDIRPYYTHFKIID